MNAASAERKYVLVVDDEGDIRRYLSAILEDSGYEVGTASDGESALEMVRARAPDLISLDLVMPKRSGAKFLFALRKNREWSRIPVLIVTGHAHGEGKADLEEIFAGKAIHGPATCLEKPVTAAGFVSAVRRQLGVSRERKPSPVPKPAAEMKSEIEDRLAGADPETMRKVLAMLRGGTAGAPTRAEGTPGVATKRVLVIDDEADVTAYLCALLSDQGYDTDFSNDPDEGLRLARERQPDLITLDVDMPTKSGVQVWREIKEDELLKGIPVVVITGIQQNLEPLFRGGGAGPEIDGYIQKPFEPDLLYATVADALRRRAED